MKKIFVLLFMLMSLLSGFSQNNNPFDYRGSEYAASMKILISDFNNGIISDFSEEGIESYTKKLPISHKASMDMVSSFLTTTRALDFNVESFINQSSLSIASKEALNKILKYTGSFKGDDFKAKLIDLTDEIKAASISEVEKEFTLSLIAIANSSETFSADLRRNAGSGESTCFLSGPNGSGYATGDACIFAGVVVGGVIGFQICGILCGLGGAIIGGIVGGLS